MILYIDEAGRGPVIGPMVIAGVILDSQIKGAKDSKELTKEKREQMFDIILKESVEVKYIIISPEEIDKMRKFMSLNEIEAYYIAKLIRLFKNKFNKVYVDSPDVIQERFSEKIKKYLDFDVDIISEHKADKKYNGVSCASIVAKVIRDREIEKLEKKYNVFIGTGYPHDENTISLIKNKFKNGEKPEYIRYSWETTKRILNDIKNKQKSLFDFG